ncbi:hypothetical protein FRX31_026724 [Thalictrum thalictroides]|uniref:Uncharacterized protein n=1 Tax=Thalictrum thalictroides TaxID=46969 RepID=A0A7J6VF17_THATH|nr:hypothetical protein FRX31_026724 [Thalictrum thalictroides]
MDLIDDHLSKSDEVIETVELLDDYWFFQNLLHKKNGICRSSSDPYPSSNNSIQEVFAQIQSKESSGSTNHSKENGFVHQNLQRTPSLPVSIGRGKGMGETESTEREATHRTNKLTRQTSLCSSYVLPPLHASKTISPSTGIPKRQARRESLVESTIKDSKPRLYKTKDKMHRSLSQNNKISNNPSKLEIEDVQGFKDSGRIKESIPRPYKTKDMLQRSLSQNIKISKSPSELEIEEVQGFKDLGFDFEKIDLNPSVKDILPGLQIKKPDDWNEQKVRRPYLSEAWIVQRSIPLMPDWIDPGSAGDMKEQLKYWARAVASNMRQEC